MFRSFSPLAILVLTLSPLRSEADQPEQNLNYSYLYFQNGHDNYISQARVLDILHQTPASRFGNLEEFIGATLLLASAKVSSFITGIEVIVDGGFHAMTICPDRPSRAA